MLHHGPACNSAASLRVLHSTRPSPLGTTLLQGGQRGAVPDQGPVPPQQAGSAGAGQPQSLQVGGQGSQGGMAPQAGHSSGPGRAFLEQRQGPQQVSGNAPGCLATAHV